MKKNEYAETLVEYVKEVGKFLEENADKIVPDVPFIGDLTLEITFDQEMGSWFISDDEVHEPELVSTDFDVR